jgi:hypothetical protein
MPCDPTVRLSVLGVLFSVNSGTNAATVTTEVAERLGLKFASPE